MPQFSTPYHLRFWLSRKTSSKVQYRVDKWRIKIYIFWNIKYELCDMKQKLGDLAEISLGFAVQGSVKPDPDGNVRIVRPANGNERLSIDWEGVVRMTRY